MTHFITEPLGKLLSAITHPIATVNYLKYKKTNPNASDIELRNLPLLHLGNLWNEEEINLWNKLSAMIDYTYPIDKLQKTDRSADQDLESELKYCIKFAAYAYFMAFFGNPTPKDINFIIKDEDKDIPAIGHKTKHIAEPGYFIGIDETNKRIVLCIRGTMTMGDTITDLHAIPDRLSFGINQNKNGPFYHCHPGIFNAANHLHTKVKVTDKIIKYLAEGREDYKIFVTGHSLGAGVCSMLGLLWKSQNVFEDDKFKCFSFASPLVIGKDGVNKSISSMNDSQMNMYSVAVESDIVTRLSVKGIVQLSKRIELISKNKPNKGKATPNETEMEDDKKIDYKSLCDRIQKSKIERNQITSAELHDLDSLKNALEAMDDDKYKIKLKNGRYVKPKELADLYPAGRVLWFVPDCVVDGDIGYNKYEHLCNLVELQTSSFSTVRVIQLLYGILCAFFVIDGEKLCEFKDAKDRFEFTQMIVHGNESFHAHFPSRYLNGFGVHIIDIFRMSQTYQRWEKRLNWIPTWIRDILFGIIIVIGFCVLRVIGFIGDVIDLFF